MPNLKCNWEVYEEDIKRLGVDNFAINSKTKELVSCDMIKCKDCFFHNGLECGEIKTKWLYKTIL